MNGTRFDAKSNRTTTIQVLFNGFSNKTVDLQISSSVQIFTINFADLGITSGYYHGIKFHPYEDGITFEINNIALISKEKIYLS